MKLEDVFDTENIVIKNGKIFSAIRNIYRA